MGKAGFASLQDSCGRIQILFRKDTLGEAGWAIYELLDIADFLGVEGVVMRTRTGEVTVEAHTLTFLSKALNPPPEKWHGLTDVEARLRERYLDLIVNDEVQADLPHPREDRHRDAPLPG